MTAVSTRSAPAGPGPRLDGAGADRRRIGPRRGLPGGRAVVGGLLVAVAAVGTFAAVAGPGRGPSTTYYVAAHDLAPGSVLTGRDIEPLALDVPERLERRVFTRPDALVGAVVVGPVSQGELIQAGGLASGADAAVPTFSVALDAANANAGELTRGDQVQVLATYGNDASATTVTLSADARVVSLADERDSIATSGQVVVRLQVASAEERSAIVNASVSGTLSLVRTSGAGRVAPAPPYRPDLGPGPDQATDTDTAAEPGRSGR